MSTPPRALAPGEIDAVLKLLWPSTGAEPSLQSHDVQRWYRQGFELLPVDGAFPLGLAQGQGGPCGVLAAVQAELLLQFLFESPHRDVLASEYQGDLPQFVRSRVSGGEDHRYLLLVRAMASLLKLVASSSDDIKVVIIDPNSASDLLSSHTYSEYVVSSATSDPLRDDDPVVRLLATQIDNFRGPHGVMNFTLSVIRTKSVDRIREEMDDQDASLTGQFGHCGQELLNLLLTGRAVSNVFDGDVPMGDTGLMLHGIHQRSRIGYLTQLEALRYCQVGTYYKSPQYPVWVIGSSSHFSVGFALDSSVCEESSSDRLFQRIQRVFKSLDPMETGFMEMGVLTQSLQQLGVARDILSNDYWMARLLSRLEISEGAGIVLWDEYWKVVSVLLHTGDFELALSGNYESVSSEAQGESRPRSDSDLARELQAQFDAEQSGNAVPIPATPAPVSSNTSDRIQEEKIIEFDWFYYNGLGSSSRSGDHEHSVSRQPQLAKCHIKLKVNGEYIGKSVPIAESGKSGGHGSPPLEEIIKTKWTNAEVHWASGQVPSVD